MEEKRRLASKSTTTSSTQSNGAKVKSPAARPLYSSKLGDDKARGSETANSSPTSTRQPAVPQDKALSSRTSIPGRSQPSSQQANFNSQSKQSVTASFREGQRVRITHSSGAEYEGIYANHQSDSSSFLLRMVQPRKSAGDVVNGTGKREQTNMSFQRKDVVDGRPMGSNTKPAPNGNRTGPGFRTDNAISNRPSTGGGRSLQRWVPDAAPDDDGGLESTKSTSQGGWDQFAENKRLFGIDTDYDENIYTTTIDKSHPQYNQRMAKADQVARSIESTAPVTSHVAEERVMDYAGGNDKGGDEEDKYSGVRRQDRQDFPPLATTRENKYTPPARRAPTGQSTVAGAPVDPAIISSQIKAPPNKKQAPAKAEEAKSQAPTPGAATAKQSAAPSADKTPESKPEPKTEAKTGDAKVAEPKGTDSKAGSQTTATLKPSAATNRAASPQDKDAAGASNAGSTIEQDVLKHFRTFATQQRTQADKARTHKAKQDAQVKLQELKKFADNFKLSTPVPTDLIPIIAKDPAKQKQIQAKAIQDAEEVTRSKDSPKENDVQGTADQPKTTERATGPSAPTTTGGDSRTNSRPTAPQHTPSPSGAPNRHPNARQSYAPSNYHQQQHNRNNQSAVPHGAQGRGNTGNLAERLRAVDRDRFSRVPPQHQQYNQEMRLPPTGPANSADSNYGRRLSAVQPSHMAAKLNPNSHEFRPSPFAASFNPTGPSTTASSPRSAVNNVAESQSTSSPQVVGQLIRRKTKAIDIKKCYILAHVKTIQPPPGRNWDENNGLRPAFDTPPTWRQAQDGGEPDSTIRITYKEYFERLPFAGASMATPNPAHAVPQLPHQHQLPFHLQHGAHTLPRQSPHMPPMQMHTGQHGHVPHVSFNNGDDHRMMPSHSAQSYAASPRMPQVPMYAPQMGSPAQMPYNQTVVQPGYMPGTPQMNQFRNFSNSPQYMPQQSSPMAVPMMPQQQFMGAPNNMMPSGPQMPVFPGNHPQYIQAAAPQPMPGTNGYPSPGRPAAAPMMVQQGSQQGQPMYGVSPSMQFQQPVFAPQHPGQMPMRGYSNPGPQQYGTSPQQMHQYNPQQRSGSNNYNKSFQGHNQHHGHQGSHGVPTGPQGRAPDGPEEAK